MQTLRTQRARALALLSAALVAVVSTPVSSAFADDTPTLTPPPVASVVTTVSPARGFVTGGTRVTVTGSAFTGATAATFGAVPATTFTVISDDTLTAISPVLEPGTYELVVTTPAGTTTSAATFTVSTLENEVLRLVNEARGSARKCGSTTFKAAPPLRANSTLARVAAAHSADMAQHSFFSHNSRNGKTPFARMKSAGYRYSYAGENIAAGFSSPATVVKAWLNSPGHCRNIMKRKYTQIGVGVAMGGYYGSYWTQDFGTPR